MMILNRRKSVEPSKMIELLKVKQFFRSPTLGNMDRELHKELQINNMEIDKGANIAIAVGSRGIANIDWVIKHLVQHIKRLGGVPFIIPAMGSHGGATARGQVQVLKSLGICEEKVGAPVKSSLRVVELKRSRLGSRVFFDRISWESDGVILVNRIKPHTDYRGSYESGLVKMSVIGIGKHEAALEIHKYGVDGLKNHIPEVSREIVKTGKILMGIAIVENARDETMLIKALKPDDIFEEEPKLLKIARDNMPKLPVDKMDILIVDRIGKDLSGTGFDPNIIGRIKIHGVEEPQQPRIKNIITDDLSSASHGNAVGIGFAECITKKLYEKINFDVTYENIVTSTFFERAKVPIVARHIKHAYEIVRRSLGDKNIEDERTMRIQDTLHLEKLYVSKAIYREIREHVELMREPICPFKKNGELIEF